MAGIESGARGETAADMISFVIPGWAAKWPLKDIAATSTVALRGSLRSLLRET
jgi:hypothetical protein